MHLESDRQFATTRTFFISTAKTSLKVGSATIKGRTLRRVARESPQPQSRIQHHRLRMGQPAENTVDNSKHSFHLPSLLSKKTEALRGKPRQTVPKQPLHSSKLSDTTIRQDLKIGDWIMGQMLGSGVFGEVFKALLVDSGRTIAVKRLFARSSDDNNPAKTKQIGILKRLNHPNIVRYYGSETKDGHEHIYMEYVSEKSLRNTLDVYGSLPERTIKVYLQQILLALNYLHSQKVVHKDLKAANILLDHDGKIKLTDFGCAVKTGSSVKDSDLKGSILWMAPEVMRQEPHTWKCDIWSVGCVLIQLAIGKLPWYELDLDNELSALLSISNSAVPPKIPDGISEPLKNLISMCLQLDPKKRPSCAQLLQSEYFRC